jgi:hypothetical protein
MKKNYRWMCLKALRKDKCAGQGYAVADKLHGFFADPPFLPGPFAQSTLSAGYRWKGDEKHKASDRSSRAPCGTQTK